MPSATTGEATRQFQRLSLDFEASNPDITVEFTALPTYEEVVRYALREHRAGLSAGLFVAELSTTLELREAGAIIPFEKGLGKDLYRFKSALLPVFLGNSTAPDGLFWGAPYFRSMPMAYFNLDKLAEVGIEARMLPSTWEEFEKVLTLLKGKMGRAPFALGGDWYDWIFEALVMTTGGGLVGPGGQPLLDDEGAVESLAFLKRLKDQELLMRLQGWKPTINGFAGDAFPVVFYSTGGARIVEDGARFAWTVHPIPKRSANASPTGGGNLFFSAHMSEEERAASARFVYYLYSPEIQAAVSERTGYFPVVAKAFEEPLLARHYGPGGAFEPMRRHLVHSRPRMMTLENARFRMIVKEAIDRTLDGGMAPAESLGIAQKEAKRLLNR